MIAQTQHEKTRIFYALFVDKTNVRNFIGTDAFIQIQFVRRRSALFETDFSLLFFLHSRDIIK